MKDTVAITLRRFMDDCGVPAGFQDDIIHYLQEPQGLLAGADLNTPITCLGDMQLSEMIRSCGIQATLLGDYDGSDHHWITNLNYVIGKSTWSIGKQGQFTSCSYQELTSCVYHRLQSLREYREFLSSGSEYFQVKWLVRMSMLSVREEVRYLLDARRAFRRDSRVAVAVLRESLKSIGSR